MATRKPRCSHGVTVNALGVEQAAACFQPATQRIVMPGRIVHRCERHALDAEHAADQGWTIWPTIKETA
jgi:hypothetical protein